MCAGYAREIAEMVSKKSYPPGPAWELTKRAKVTYSAEFDSVAKKGGIEKETLAQLILDKKITKGTLVGCYFTESPHNLPKRPFTHVLVYLGEGKFAQNLNVPGVVSISELYSTGKMFPVCVLEPKN
jgi:cell wall-associated NlpC family hydrolase